MGCKKLRGILKLINIKKTKKMKPNIGITEENKQAVSVQLAKLLADEFVLYAKTRNAHWNVEGVDFHSMHLFFETQYEQLDEIMDSVAERIRTIGHYAPATLKSYAQYLFKGLIGYYIHPLNHFTYRSYGTN